ncbi:31575_t:CDS:2 [Racocetra persica]|uniref:31575_t:CDS:1 n=1 Tax=Racocetra persica TaxID=160502 RepID=A0ACA9Q3M1_9GLOM|nr:31575_t:CDS:2 [Racocetra persica]
MTIQSTPVLMAFYHVAPVENWTCVNVVEYYRSKIGKKDFKEVLDRIKKDLQEIANSNSDFDTIRKRKAQEIIDNWKISPYSDELLVRRLAQAGTVRMDSFDEEPEKRSANQYSEQQILASGAINSHCTTLGKRQNDDSEKTPKEKRQDTGDRKTINEPVEITDDPESDTQAINTEQNLDKKQVEEELAIRHALLDFIAMFKNLPKVLNRDMSERTYIVESISPIFRSFRNAFPEVKYEWIEKDVRSVKEAGSMFAINIKSRKTDLLVIRLSDATEILHVEVSGPPFKADKKHTIGDIKKLLMMAAIGDKLTLFSVSLVDKKKYLAIELASCVIPFSFEEIGCYIKIFKFFAIIRNELNEQKKLLKKFRTFVPSVEDDTSKLREWIDLPEDNLIPVTEEEMDELFLNGE